MSRLFPPMDGYFSTAKGLRIAVNRQCVTGVPESADGLKICFVTDTHLRPSMRAETIAEAIQSCRADLILMGGDYADTQEEALRLFDAFRILRAPLGIFAAMGNNDAEAFPVREVLADALQAFGCRLLVNESAKIGGLRIGAVDEYHYGQPDYGSVFPDNAGYRILISHYPILPDLMLCGHTHGGQFNFLGLTPFAIGFERTLGKKNLAPFRVSGMEKTGRTTLLVSKGIGMSRLPLRVGVRPEIHLLELFVKPNP